ncbi:MAG: hypothetical protein K6E12_11210 [Saccharofermentans sp.]|nr:hypothetical protein [Saccharofermentans sp.]
MPHSSGGGSHGGGFHGGGSHGGSGNRVSSHYFSGARRFRKHYSDGRPDEYVYARRKPDRTGITSVIVVTLFSAVFVFMGLIGNRPVFAQKLTPEYSDEPAIHDDTGVIDNGDELLNTLDEYCYTTGICPVIYTVYDEEWNSSYTDLEDYAFGTYVNNYPDEQHFVIVYSIPKSQAEGVKDGSVTVPDYSWEAVQGDDTDEIITEQVFEKFGKTVQRRLEAGKGPGEAFDSAFAESTEKLAKDMNPNAVRRVFKMLSAYIPFLIVLAFFILVIVLTVKSYIKDRGVVFEEVPLDEGHGSSSGVKAAYINADGKDDEQNSQGINIGGYASAGNRSGGNGYHKSVSLDTEKAGSKLTGAIMFVAIIPFFVAGIIMLIVGINMIKAGFDNNFGYTLLGFAVMWLIMLIIISFKFIRSIIRLRRKENEPAQVSYPTSEYPQPVFPEQNDQADFSTDRQFDPQFFQSARSDIEADDEDYKRMKRQGFE